MYDFSAPLFWYKLIFMAELIIAEGLITYTLKKRSHFIWRVLISSAVLFAFAFALPLIAFNAIYLSILFLVMFAATLVALRFCYDESWGHVLFCGILAYTAQHIAYLLCNSLTKVLSLEGFSVYEPEAANGFDPLIILVYATVYSVVYWFIWTFITYRIRKSESLRINNVSLAFFAGVIVLVDVVLNAILVYDTEPIESTLAQIVILILNLLSCSLAIAIQFSLLKNTILEDEVKMTNKLWQIDKEHYELKKDKIELINIKVHDLKHRLREYRENIGSDDEALKEIESNIDIYDSFLKTGNEVLDVVLAEESLYCQKNNIKLICVADGKQLNFIAASNLYSLFDNAIHNAVEAVSKVEDPDKRIIKLQVIRVFNMVSIHVENYCNNADSIVFSSNLPHTTKGSKENHGYGVRSMQMIAENLGGGLSIRASGDTFRLDILIPIPAEAINDSDE